MALIHALNLQSGTVSKIRFFTANVINTLNNPSIKQRQQTYLRALQTIPEVELHFGQFKLREVKGTLIDEKTNKPGNRAARIQKFEEKGSDVNIASYMLADGFKALYDVPILISNDSDLSAPLQIIKEDLKIPIGLISTQNFHMTELSKYSTFRRILTSNHLAGSQFPDVMVDKIGTFHKPKDW